MSLEANKKLRELKRFLMWNQRTGEYWERTTFDEAHKDLYLVDVWLVTGMLWHERAWMAS